MENLRLFETEAEYHDAADNLRWPTVSYITETDGVVINDYDYSDKYLTFEALESGTFTLTIPAAIDTNYMTSVSYSTDDGETWTTTQVDATAQTITTPTINQGDIVLWKGIGTSISSNQLSPNGITFSATNNFNVLGNITSLLFGDDFKRQTSLPENAYFAKTFYGNTKLVSAEKLFLPSGRYFCLMFGSCSSLTTPPKLRGTTLAGYCYYKMFRDCSSLTTAPVLPATTLASSCYQFMFWGCTSLTTAPALPATTLASSCYQYMFNGCTALTTAPELPATTLAQGCYQYMFQGCTSLTTAPVLPATTLVNNCYYQMFNGCTNLNYIKAMFTTTPTTSYTGNWVIGVAATGTFVKNSAAQWTDTGINAVPSGWTVETASS